MADIFAVVADHTRRELLGILLRRRSEGIASGDASVSELVAELALSQPTVSKHLKVLREAGLVTVREKGQHRYYRLEPDGLAGVGAWVGPFLPAALGESAAQDGSHPAREPASAASGLVAGADTGDGHAIGGGEAEATGVAEASGPGSDGEAPAGPVPGARFAALLGRLAGDVAFRLRRS
jgi:ArsR family transcriptional regulator, arsenate/arsenite/antimonite-responsive transcriptional repressor